MLHSYFNPRSRVGNDRSGLNMVQPLLLFQSAFPRGERRSTVPVLPGTTADFNPRSRVGNDGIDTWKRVSEHIFQSTFPRGERLASERHLRLFLYFNPRSRVGNDHSSLFRIKKSVNFNPRSRVGNDRQEYDDLKAKCISIHVPAWGTTMTRRNDSEYI